MVNNNTTPVSVDALAVGRSSTNAFITVFSTRNPNSLDVNYTLQQRWYNTTLQSEWILTGFSVVSEVKTADWQPISASLASSETLSGNTGGPVGVDIFNNINVIGAGDLTVTGNPGTNTLTISQSGVVATSYVENSGTATPSGGVLNVLGGTGITTVGAGNTITINATTATPLTFTENTGTATPSANNINILGTGGITTSGAGSTVSITTSGTVATLYTEDTGTATPSGGNLNIVGGTGISTSGAGNTVTITATGANLIWTVIAASQTLAVNHGYVCGGGGTLSLALPAVSALGDIIEVTLDGSTGWVITQSAGQQIRLGSSTSTSGAGGSIASTAQGDTFRMVCRTANTLWQVLSSIGNITIV